MKRHFLLLQGPVGPFFNELASELRLRGHKTTKVNFFGGDMAYDPDGIKFTGTLKEWPNYFLRLCNRKGITDILLFGDRRSYHEIAIEVIAEATPNMRVWVFEEGYFRPNWVTMDQYGANARSALPSSHQELVNASEVSAGETASNTIPVECAVKNFVRLAPRYFGTAVWNLAAFPNYKYHRLRHPMDEGFGWAKSYAMKMLGADLEGEAEKFRNWSDDTSFYVAALQLESDFQMRRYSPVRKNEELIEHIISEFATSAPEDVCLVFKCHPYDDKWQTWIKATQRIAESYDVADRVACLHKVAAGEVLDSARGMVTVNSTFALCALDAGVPVKALGDAFWNFHPMTESNDLSSFFRDPRPVDPDYFARFKRVVMERTQFNGSFYSKRGRKLCISRIADQVTQATQDTSALSAAPLARLHHRRSQGKAGARWTRSDMRLDIRV